MFCAPLPLKLTVFGSDEVTFNIPAVIVNTPATPRVALEDNCKEVPLIVLLKRLAVPLKLEVPVKVTVPADAVKLPLTERLEAIVKLAVVVMMPETEREAKFIVPAPDMVFDVPIITIGPALAMKLPLTVKLPVSTIDDVVVTVPLIVKLFGTIETPLIVVPVPDIVKVPPDACVNDPEPVVAKFPVKLSPSAEKLTIDAATVTLLKF